MATSTVALPACVGLSSFALSANMSRPKSSHCRPSLSLVARGGVIRNSRISQSKVLSPSTSLGFVSSSITETRMRGSQVEILNLGKGSRGGALGAACSLPTSPETLRWIFVAAASVLLFLKNVAIPKQFLVPLLAIETPRQALGWLKGDYGLWAAFAALAVKLFYYIPAELELPLYVLLLIIVAPAQLTQYRATIPAAVGTLGVGAYLAYQHFQTSGSLKATFKGEKIFPSIAIILLLIVPILFLAYGTYA